MVTLSPQQFREIIQRVPALVVSANGHVEQLKMGTSQHGKYAAHGLFFEISKSRGGIDGGTHVVS